MTFTFGKGDLLTREKVTVAEVAARVGYSSASTFSVAFTRHPGCRPRTTRERKSHYTPREGFGRPARRHGARFEHAVAGRFRGRAQIWKVDPADVVRSRSVDGSRTRECQSRRIRVAARGNLYYRGRKMSVTRPGKTVKVSVSIDRADLAVLRRRARESYSGNLSAAFSEAARLIRQRAARTRLIDMLGGPSLTATAAGTIDGEQAGRPEPKKRRARAA
jgi:hypothetical protein